MAGPVPRATGHRTATKPAFPSPARRHSSSAALVSVPGNDRNTGEAQPNPGGATPLRNGKNQETRGPGRFRFGRSAANRRNDHQQRLPRRGLGERAQTRFGIRRQHHRPARERFPGSEQARRSPGRCAPPVHGRHRFPRADRGNHRKPRRNGRLPAGPGETSAPYTRIHRKPKPDPAAATPSCVFRKFRHPKGNGSVTSRASPKRAVEERPKTTPKGREQVLPPPYRVRSTDVAVVFSARFPR